MKSVFLATIAAVLTAGTTLAQYPDDALLRTRPAAATDSPPDLPGSRPVAAKPPLRAADTPAADINLYGVRAIAALDNAIVRNPRRQPVGVQVVAIRLEVEALRRKLAAAGADPEVLELADDLKTFCLKYEATLVATGAINQKAQDELSKVGDDLLTRIGGSVAGNLAGKLASYVVVVGAKGAGYAVHPIVGDIAGQVVDSGVEWAVQHFSAEFKAGRINKERLEAILREFKALTDGMDAEYERHRKLVDGLAEKYAWQKGEWGYDNTDDEDRPFHRPETEDGVPAARLKAMAAFARRRVRDPFAQMEYAQYLAAVTRARTLTAQQMRAEVRVLAAVAGDIARAADHVPPGFDGTRADLFATAGDIQNTSSSYDVMADGGSLFARRSPYARTAITYWKAAIKHNGGEDPDGYLRMRLAWATIHDGDREGGVKLST